MGFQYTPHYGTALDQRRVRIKKRVQQREKNRCYVDSRAEIPGVVMENSSMELTESFVRDLCAQHHQIVLAFAMPDDRKTFVRKPELELVHGGALSFRPANTQYRVILGPGKYNWFQASFDPEHFPQIGGSVAEWDFQALCNITGSPLEASLQRMAAEVADPGTYSEAFLASFGGVVVADLIRFLQGAEQKSPRGTLSQKQLHRIVEYVERNGEPAPQIQDLSKLLGISRRHLTRMFKASTGRTIYSYVSQERIRKAIGMLTTTNLTAKEISAKLGYTAPWGFSAAFQRAIGETPTEFRRRFRDKSNGIEISTANLVRLATTA